MYDYRGKINMPTHPLLEVWRNIAIYTKNRNEKLPIAIMH